MYCMCTVCLRLCWLSLFLHTSIIMKNAYMSKDWKFLTSIKKLSCRKITKKQAFTFTVN